MIRVSNLKKSYATYQRGAGFAEVLKSVFARKRIWVEALKGISFGIGDGELVGFLGPNGAGKSTTLKILCGVLFPSSGEVEVLGFVPWKQRKRYVANIGAVFGQKSQLVWDIPPLDSFMMNQAIYGIAERDFRSRLGRLSEMLGVADLMRQPTRSLSLGERMKCEFIMAMLHDPKVVFLDEPTIGLDVLAKEAIRLFIGEMNAKGVTFILTTHDLDDVERLAKRVILVNHGELVFDDGIDSLKRFFGERKRIRVVTERELDPTAFPGLSLIARRGATDCDVELDLRAAGIGDFIAWANAELAIKDLSIEEIPIEEVIKALYSRE
jgi:ABC-2 type transport system ATP-binding protein